MCVDANGNPVYFEITGEQVQDSQVVGMTIENIGEATHFIADKGYDSELIREQARQSKKPNTEFDSYLHKLRHLVENLFARLKHTRSIAIRFEK